MIRSFPALRQALRQLDQLEPTHSAAAAFEAADLVPAYRVPDSCDVAREARILANAVSILAERVVRLESVYGHWHPFEPGPYFDLRSPHAALMCQVEESGSLVHVRLYADLLSPSFRAAERFCMEQFLPALRSAHVSSSPGAITRMYELRDRIWPALYERLERAEQVLRGAADILTETGHVCFLIAWGAIEERRRTISGNHAASPTLTLDFTFPLPLRRRPRRREILRRRLQRRRAAGRPLLRRSGADPGWHTRPRRGAKGNGGGSHA
ncbi:MAG: hypothetical protein GXP39_04010 [Chloroflexi bacterium]|nr:hypothetical protein [Chloroflexota bacterium]